MDFKSTLLLPKSEMPLNANLTKNEQGKYAEWHSSNVYGRMKRDGKNLFILHDGPPYANGDIHIGHALNKILKDFVVKTEYFNGRSIHFVPGWDCHGLPIEQKVKEKSTDKIRAACRQYAAETIEKQKSQFKSLGVIADWAHHYETMSAKFEAEIYRSFYSLIKSGNIARRKKPIYWSWAEQTALAEAEIEYKEKEDETVYVFFEDEKYNNVGLLAWTTTPWTLPANVAVAVHPDKLYVLAKAGLRRLWVAEELLPKLYEKGICENEYTSKVSGKFFEGKYWRSPLTKKLVPSVTADFVTTNSGTGLVHIAPGHGVDDYKVGLRHKLNTIMIVGPDGKFTEGVYTGKRVFDCNNMIIEDMEIIGTLVHREKIVHSYPHCWRSGKPIIFRATEQWFLDLDGLRKEVLERFSKVIFYPEQSSTRMKAMLEGREDWCLSRQREWGVPIAFFRHQSGELILDDELVNSIADIFESETCDAWKDMPRPPDSEPINDVMDVWFDSGLTWNFVPGKADVYLEGNDQHRGWFQSSLWLCVALTGDTPYNKVITHSFVVDENKQKMSKSKGNVVSPLSVVEKYGAEVLRYWVAATDYTREVCVSDNILKGCAEGYRKLRNTLRFLVSNLDTLTEHVTVMMPIDSWIMSTTYYAFQSVYESFDKYEFWVGLHKLNNYIVNDLSGIYMNAAKDRLYCEPIYSEARRSCQYAIRQILRGLIRLIAPIFTYTANEVLSYCPVWVKLDANDIFDIPTRRDLIWASCEFRDGKWKKALSEFHKEFDKLKSVGLAKDTLEVYIESDDLFFRGCEDWFGVSGCYGNASSGGSYLGEFEVDKTTFVVVKSLRNKCQRCWKRNAKQDLCSRCEDAIRFSGDGRIRNTNLTAWTVVAAIGMGMSDAEIIEHYPELTLEDIDFSVRYNRLRKK